MKYFGFPPLSKIIRNDLLNVVFSFSFRWCNDVDDDQYIIHYDGTDVFYVHLIDQTFDYENYENAVKTDIGFWTGEFLLYRGWQQSEIDSYLVAINNDVEMSEYLATQNYTVEHFPYRESWETLKREPIKILYEHKGLFLYEQVKKIEQEHILANTDLGVRLFMHKLTS